MTKYTQWKIADCDPLRARKLEEEGFSPLIAAVFSSRGVSDEDARALISEPHTGSFHDPFLMKDMDSAVKRINKAIAAGERTAVFGDYDVDGVTSTALLVRYFRSRGLDCEYYIPDRLGEGYGLSCAAIDSLAELGVTLIVTVDCGITAIQEAAHARDIGIDMVITDHHECQGALPEAVAAIDPKRADCGYPNSTLAGVGVAFKLICAIEGKGSEQRLINEYGDLVALGTIADVMPVTGENRALIKLGIRCAGSDMYPGLGCLIEEAGLAGRGLTCTGAGYSLSPRINAAGRMGRAMLAEQLLLTRDAAEARDMARELCSLNRDRQQLEADIFAEAVSMLRTEVPDDAPIILSSDSWHQGVAGIVASRLSERFCRPSVIVCFDGDMGRGSCRSFGGFSIFSALENASDLLEDFGGHELAAGLLVKRENFPALCRRLTEYYRSHPSGESPVLNIDVEINSPHMLTQQSVATLSSLEPFGHGNEQPLFCMRSARLRSVTPIGGGKHVKLTVSCMGQNYECAFFSKPASELGFRQGELVDIAFWPQVNDFRGKSSVQLLLSAIRPAAGSSGRRSPAEKFEAGEKLTESEASALLPERQDFVKLWKRLQPECLKGPVCCDTDSLIWALSVSCSVPAPRCRICLKVFNELGLLTVSENGAVMSVSLPETPHRADLDSSLILKSLRG